MNKIEFFLVKNLIPMKTFAATFALKKGEFFLLKNLLI